MSGDDHQLLERAEFTLAHDSHGGQQQRHEHEQDPGDRGDVVDPALEVGVVPGLWPDLQAAGGPGPGDVPDPTIADIALDYLRGGSAGQVGRHRVRAVHQDLDFDRAAGPEVAVEPRRDLDHDQGVAAIEGARGSARGAVAPRDAEFARGLERVGQPPRFGAAVVVHEQERGEADVGVHRVAEHDQLHHRRDENQPLHPRVAEHLAPFLAHQLAHPEQPFPHGSISLRKERIASARPTTAKPSGQELGPEHREADALEEDAPGHDDEVPGGHRVAQAPEHRGIPSMSKTKPESRNPGR